MNADATHSWEWPAHYDFLETVRSLGTGGKDPTVRLRADGWWRTVRLPEGPATVRLSARPRERIEADAWGRGAEAALRSVPRWLGLDQPPWRLPGHPVTDRLLRERPGIRLNDTGDVFEALLITVLQQLVTWQEAAFVWRRLVERFGEPAPGPAGLRLIPTPRAIRAAGIDRLAGLGMERRKALVLHEVAFAASRLQRAAELPTDQAAALLQNVRGVGPWTSAMVLGARLGRPEPVVCGDVHLPHLVCWALAREPRGSDERMVELLEPFAGHAFRVVRLLSAAGITAPRRAPRREIRFGRRR